MLGTASFDIRSFHLNVELNLVWSDVDLSGLMRFYHTKCIQESKKLDLTDGGAVAGAAERGEALSAQSRRPPRARDRTNLG